jgi:hypothetical protein
MNIKKEKKEDKKGKKEKKNVRIIYAKICPRCKSINVEIGKGRLEAIGFPVMYRCLDCGFRNYNFPEKRIEIPKNKSRK